MKIFRSVVLAAVVLAAAALTQNASALITLPDSTFTEAEGNWQGSREYTDDGYFALVEFTVYDTEGSLASEEQALVDQLAMSNRYIYAYQIYNHPTATKDLESFSVFGIDPSQILQATIDDIGSYDDGNNGIAAESSYYDDQTSSIAWDFAWAAPVAAGEHSQFLAFSSDNAPVAGDFDLAAIDYDDTPPVPNGDESNDVPEPATIILLAGAGFYSIRSKRKRAV